MADTKIYIMAEADDFSIACDHFLVENSVYGQGNKVCIPYNTPENPDISRNAAWLYIGKTLQVDYNGDYCQSDIGLTRFDLTVIPTGKVIRSIRLLAWIGGGASDERVIDGQGNETWPTIPWAGSNLALGVRDFSWLTYPYPVAGPWPDLGNGDYGTGMYAGNWFKGVLKFCNDTSLTPANCGAYNLEQITVDGQPSNLRYYMPLPVKETYWPTEWGAGSDPYRVVVAFDFYALHNAGITQRHWVKIGSGNKSPGAERCFLEVVYGDLAYPITVDMHAYFEAIPPQPKIKKYAPPTVFDAHAYFEASIQGIANRVSVECAMHAYFEAIATGKTFAKSLEHDMHAFFSALHDGGTGVDTGIEADMHAFFGMLDLAPTLVNIEQDMHGYFEASAPVPPNALIVYMRNFSTSKIVPLVTVSNKLQLTGLIEMSMTFTGTFSSVKNSLDSANILLMKMTVSGNLRIGKTISVGTRMYVEVNGLLNIRGDA